MKKRLLVISLTLVLILSVLAPVTALAAKPVPFSAEGTIISISPGDVAPAGVSGRYRVIERVITGDLTGDISGPFTLTYKANVELVTQAGRFVGDMEAGSSQLKVNGQIQPVEVIAWLVPDVVPYLLRMTIDGHWTVIKGQGNGDFSAVIVFEPDWVLLEQTGEIHVGNIHSVLSPFIMTGQQ